MEGYIKIMLCTCDTLKALLHIQKSCIATSQKMDKCQKVMFGKNVAEIDPTAACRKDMRSLRT